MNCPHFVWGPCTGSLGTDSMFEVFGRPEGTEADRLAMEVVMVVAGHADATIEGMECPMSNFLYFLLLWDLLLLFLPDLFSLTGVKGLQSLFMAFFLFLFVISHLLPEGRKGLHLPAPGAVLVVVSLL